MKPCPNPTCKSSDVYVADRCGYVICRKCGMSGPVVPVGNDEEAEKAWDALPREDESRTKLLEETLKHIHQELRIGPNRGDGLWRLRAMKTIKTALEG